MGKSEPVATGKGSSDSRAAPGGMERQDALLAELNRPKAIATIGDWGWDIATNSVRWSDELFRIYGFEPHEIPPDYELVLRQMHPSSRDEFERAIDAALNEDRHFEMDYQFYRKDGTEGVLHTVGKVIRNQDGAPLRMVGLVQDITERKQALKDLEESEKKYRSFVENLEGIAYRADVATWTAEFFHGKVEEITGYSEEEFIAGKPRWDQVIHPDDFERLPGKEELISVPGFSCEREYRIVRKDGQVRWVEEHTQNTGVDSNNILSIQGIIIDVTDRRLAIEALGESEENFREFVMVQSDPIQVIDTDGTILICNDASAAAHGSSPTELIGKSAFDGMPAAVVAERRALLERVVSAKQTIVIEEEFKGKYYETMISPIEDKSGKVVKIAIFPHDITRRKRAEEKLRDREEYIRNILDSVDEGFVVIDLEYRIHVANKAYCEQVSLPSNEVLGRHCYEVSHRSERPCYEVGEDCAVQKVFATGKPHSAVHKHPGREGQVLYVETKAFPVKDPSGRVTSAIETINNITERHLLQEERLKTQKLESIGTLAGGIAHDFNNLLQGVFGHISMARMSIDQKDQSLAMLEAAEEALHRTVSLTNQLLTFSKGGKPVKEPFPVLPVIESAARFALSGSSSEYEVLPKCNLCLVNGDAGQIAQVIQNITLNADQSMPQGGKIRFSVRKIAADSEMPAVLKNGEYVLISISDNGHGIPEEFQERIFDPYFTTKDRGSGLGLATSYSIVRNHGGIIVMESRVGEGTTFSIYLPAALEKIQEQEPASALTEVSSAKVLIMDDEEIIREVTGNLLRALGHECEFAEKGESAVAKFKAARDEGRPFDLVLLDLTIRGGMGGVETIRELLAIDPEVKAIVSSGYSDDAVLSDYQTWGFKMFLKKPYKLEELQRAVNSLLA
jgi:PAS domain S-box-containing protein